MSFLRTAKGFLARLRQQSSNRDFHYYSRWWAIVKKEFIQLRRDYVTLAMMVIVPISQTALFGFAINTDPKHLPTAIISADNSVFSRTFINSMKNSDYFDIQNDNFTKAEAKQALKSGKVLFVLHIPPNFSRNILRGETPEILLEADASDPNNVNSPIIAITGMLDHVFQEDFNGPLSHLYQNKQPYTLNSHLLYNPEKITQYNIIPGLIGAILLFSLTMVTAMAITRERERGTMEQLLAMPLRPYEVIAGKIIPYVLIGVIQATFIIIAGFYVFNIPFLGSLFIFYIVVLLFISVTISIGVSLSSFASNQMESLQFTIMYLLPSLLLSGFMFPFAGMPLWAQYLGNLLPLTHFVSLARAIMLKGSSFIELWPHVWPLIIMQIILFFLAVKFYRKTLD